MATLIAVTQPSRCRPTGSTMKRQARPRKGPPQASKQGKRLTTIIGRLKKAHPDAKLALDFSSPFELLIALILAAQCTDEKVNEVTGTLLFRKYRSPADYVRVPATELEADIRPTGFYRNKTKAVQAC